MLFLKQKLQRVKQKQWHSLLCDSLHGHTMIVSPCVFLKKWGASLRIFNNFEACNLAGPMGRWSIQHNKRESFFSGERNLFCTVWDILMIERLVLARAPFSNSVELKSEMLPVSFYSIMNWFSGKKKKKSWKFGKDNLYLYLHTKRGKAYCCCIHIVLTATYSV